MGEHECTQEYNINKLLKVVTDGNGQPSLVQQIGSLNTKIDLYMVRQEDLIKEWGIFSGEMRAFRAHVETVEMERDKSDNRKRWRIGVVVTICIAILSITTSILVKNFDRKMSVMESRQNWTEMDMVGVYNKLGIRPSDRGNSVPLDSLLRQ